MSRNVVLICLDAVRKDYFDRNAPRTRAAADLAIDGCRAASPWTVPSHGSAFTGRLPSETGIYDPDVDFGTLEGDTFLSVLSDHTTIGVSANPWLSSTFGFDSLFDRFEYADYGTLFSAGMDAREFVDRVPDAGLQRGARLLREAAAHDHPAKSVANAVAAKVRSRTTRFGVPALTDDGAGTVSRRLREATDEVEDPFFAYVNLMDGHDTHRPHVRLDRDRYSAPVDWDSTGVNKWAYNADPSRREPTYLRRYRELYAANIAYLDSVLADLFEYFAATPRETTVIVTADHGENLGYAADDGLIEHVGSLTEALLHVPLYVINPPEGLRIGDGYVSQLELGRLVRAAANDDPDAASDLARERIPAELVGTRLPSMDRADADLDTDYWSRSIRAVYEGERKYQWDSLDNRYEYAIDAGRPCWQNRVADGIEIPPEAHDLFATEIGSVDPDGAAADVDGDTASRLRDLGYL
ncbi:sulfatase-like hydrolase/transferase [Saliphagus sp. LR7]|uniref:sulfatase-like hydrolase/transferase n=1 Tax=Saliphagus sp. LR7 TaxID=2282654 RepID=UPI0013009197|nr:sulfatase-like hydrolase/transferase [Saliphagus sp. LR7]